MPDNTVQSHCEAVDSRERHDARDAQLAVEQHRLTFHRRIAIELLSDGKRCQELLLAAHAEVDRWARDGLCSRDYIDRWNHWLALPVAVLSERMCSDSDEWGRAMRQNSPFRALPL